MTTPENVIHQRIRADRTGEKLINFVLATTLEAVGFTGLTKQQVRDDVKALEEMGILVRVNIGRFRTDMSMILLDKGLARYGASEVQRTWLGPAGLRHVVRWDLHRLQAVKDIIRQVDTDGPVWQFDAGGWVLKGIQLHDRASVFATAEHHRPGETGENAAYTVFICTDRMDTERRIFHRLEAVRPYLESIAEGDAGEFRPSRVCIVAPNEWGTQTALRLALEVLVPWVSPGNISVWHYEKGDWCFSDGYSASTGEPPETLPLRPSTGRLTPQPNTRRLPGNPRALNRELTWSDFRHTVTPPRWSGRAGPKMVELLTFVGDYPVGALGHYKALAGEVDDSSRTERRLKELVRLELVEVVLEEDCASEGDRHWSNAVPRQISPRGQGEPRHKLTDAGMLEYCKVNGGASVRLASRTELGRVSAKKWLLMHADFCYEILIQFLEMGCPVVPGWQVRITLADGSCINPDGAVRVYIPGWGMWWCYVEVELSDRYGDDVKNRCKRYASEKRLDDSPVFFVVYNGTVRAQLPCGGARVRPGPDVYHDPEATGGFRGRWRRGLEPLWHAHDPRYLTDDVSETNTCGGVRTLLRGRRPRV